MLEIIKPKDPLPPDLKADLQKLENMATLIMNSGRSFGEDEEFLKLYRAVNGRICEMSKMKND